MARIANEASGAEAADTQRTAVQLEAAIGEALFASTLATLTLTSQVATGQMSHDQVSALLDGATLVLERHRGTDPHNAGAVDYARNRMTALLDLLEQMRQIATATAGTGRGAVAQDLPVG